MHKGVREQPACRLVTATCPTRARGSTSQVRRSYPLELSWQKTKRWTVSRKAVIEALQGCSGSVRMARICTKRCRQPAVSHSLAPRQSRADCPHRRDGKQTPTAQARRDRLHQQVFPSPSQMVYAESRSTSPKSRYRPLPVLSSSQVSLMSSSAFARSQIVV